MKEYIFTKPSQLGEIKITLRIIGKIIYMKFNQSQHADQAIASMKSKGALIEKGNGWIRINIFYSVKEDLVNLGNYEIDLKNDSSIIIENKLGNFYVEQYIKSGFKLENAKS